MELSHAQSREELVRLAKHFATRLVNYDFWDDTPMWELIPHYGVALKRFLVDINPSEHDIMELWRCLAILPRNYEEVCREWFLPTCLGLMAAYPSQKKNKQCSAC